VKTIPLTRGQVALVDDQDYERLARFRWHYQPGKKTGYAVRNVRVGPRKLDKKIQIRMHKEILQVSAGQQVDHRDGDGLNNQRDNLRASTNQQNQHNARKHQNGTASRFKGVSRAQKRDAWVARIRINGRIKYLGYFKDERDAARAYDSAAVEHFGEFAKINGANITSNGDPAT